VDARQVEPALGVEAADLASGGHERGLRRMRATFARQVEQTADAVARHFPAGTRMTRPNGGYVLWVELPRNVDVLALHERAAREHVSFAPGTMFSPRGGFRNCLRLNCGYPFTERTDMALRIIARLAGSRASAGAARVVRRGNIAYAPAP
jgi:DNA-binding transcriptional MocR family regulator